METGARRTDGSDVVEIRPNKIRTILPARLVSVFMLGCGAMFSTLIYVASLTGFYLYVTLILAVLSIGIGAAVGFSLRRKLRHQGPTWVLSPTGLTNCLTPGRFTIPWGDIQEIGIVAHSGMWKLPGIRLRRYDGYLSSLTPEGMSYLHKSQWNQSMGVGLFKLLGLSVPQGSSTNPAERILQGNRRLSGYDLGFAAIDLDRPGEAMTDLLRSYFDRFGKDKTAEADY